MIAALTACKDSEDEPNIGPTTPTYPATQYSKIEVKEVKSQPGTHAVTVTHTYNFDAGRLTSFNTTQGYTVGVEYFETKNATTMVYAENSAIATDEINNVSTYTLNDKGYAISCVRQEMDGRTRSYTFSYLVNVEGKHFLTKVEETLPGGRAGVIISIEHDDYKAMRITEKSGDYEQTYRAIASTDEMTNRWEIPFIFLTELHPLSLHSAAIYGKLLGDAPIALISQLKPDDNSQSNETTTYTYRLDKMDVDISCQELTNSYGRQYVRTVDYTMD